MSCDGGNTGRDACRLHYRLLSKDEQQSLQAVGQRATEALVLDDRERVQIAKLLEVHGLTPSEYSSVAMENITHSARRPTGQSVLATPSRRGSGAPRGGDCGSG